MSNMPKEIMKAARSILVSKIFVRAPLNLDFQVVQPVNAVGIVNATAATKLRKAADSKHSVLVNMCRTINPAEAVKKEIGK